MGRQLASARQEKERLAAQIAQTDGRLQTMTDRVPDENYINNNLTNLNTFSDVPSGSSAYYEIIEAANGHTYVQTNGVETWKALQ